MGKDQLQKLRTAIDTIDQELLSLIKNRLMLTAEIGRIKKENNMDIIDISREDTLFNSLEERCKEMDLDKVFIKKLWRLVLNASYQSQEK